MKFYDELISYAQKNHFKKIESGFSVTGGALAAWIKLAEKYKVIVNPNVRFDSKKDLDFKGIIQKYKDKELGKDYTLSTPPRESVFELIIE